MLEVENIVVEIMIQYQKKLGIVSEIYRLTQEIEQLLAVNDRGSTQLVLEMRQEEMDKAEQVGRDLVYLRDSMEEVVRQRLKSVLELPNGEQYAETPQEKKILDISRQIQQVLQKTVDLDKRLNMRIAGNDSYYNQKK